MWPSKPTVVEPAKLQGRSPPLSRSWPAAQIEYARDDSTVYDAEDSGPNHHGSQSTRPAVDHMAASTWIGGLTSRRSASVESGTRC
jgi:hypothetical protein